MLRDVLMRRRHIVALFRETKASNIGLVASNRSNVSLMPSRIELPRKFSSSTQFTSTAATSSKHARFRFEGSSFTRDMSTSSNTTTTSTTRRFATSSPTPTPHPPSSYDVSTPDYVLPMEHLEVFYSLYGNLHIPSTFIVPSVSDPPWPSHMHGFRLGYVIEAIRTYPGGKSRRDKVFAERLDSKSMARLAEMGFEWNFRFAR